VPGAGGDTLHYTYTLKTARLQPGADESTDVIGLAVSDAAGGSANGTLIVRIVDDTPLARPDFASVGSTDLLPASGNVHANGGAGDQADRIGADVTPSPVTAISGPGGGSFSVPAGTNSTTGTVVTGQYGSLTIGADGSYAYRPDPDNLTVTLLLSGQSLTETFRYTITDADGDQAVSTLTITILGTSQPSTQPPPPPGDPAPPGTTPPGTTPPETISPVTTPPDGSPPGVTPPGSGPTPDSGHPLVDSPRPSLAGTGGDTPTGTGGGTPTAIDPLALTLTSFLQTRLGLALAELEPAHDTNPFPRLFSDNGLTLFPRLGDGHNFELYLYGEARDQLMTELRPDTFTVPKDLFRHTNPLEHLSFEAMQPDGRALPEWLKFDRESLRFNGTPPKGFGGLDVVIIATDSQGRHAAAQFRIRPAKEVEPGPETAPAQSPAPELIPDADTPPQAARSLPAADWLAALGLHDDAAAHPAPALAPDAGHDGFSARLQQALPPTLAEQSRALADVLLAAD
ncbi:MAG TPA: VCBS domain-containing protein, partial [Plasticicumulans sp.]|nr:VCBS domain-containing protein [Plasticicumulans sp.]